MASLTTSSNPPLTTEVFVYPSRVQFPIDPVCRRIVMALKKLDWKHPEMSVTFQSLSTPNRTFTRVDTLKGPNFMLWFCRNQGAQGQLDGYWNDCAAIREVTIPGMKLTVHEDESGPSLNVSNSANCTEEDLQALLKEVPGSYSTYKGGFKDIDYTEYWPSRRRPPFLFRESSPNPVKASDLPAEYTTEEIFQKFNIFLEEQVLRKLEDFNKNYYTKQ